MTDYSSASSSLRQPCSPPERRGEIEELPPASSVVDEEEENKVYVAVPRDLKKGIEIVQWALRNTSTDNQIVLLHVHRPPKLLPMMGAMVPASKLNEEHVRNYRQQERIMAEKSMAEYLALCSKSQVSHLLAERNEFRTEKLVFENDDVGLGIVELVASHKITKLVMGAASNKYYSRKMRLPNSKVAITVQQKAHLSCKIWFVCKGHLICTRDVAIYETLSSNYMNQLRSKSLTVLETAVPCRTQTMLKLPFSAPFSIPTAKSGTSTDGVVSDSNWLLPSNDKFNGSTSAASRHKHEDSDSSSLMAASKQDSETPHLSPTFHMPENGDFARVVYDRLELIQTETENLKNEAYSETIRRQRAERNAMEVAWKAEASKFKYTREQKLKTELQKTLKDEMDKNERLKKGRDEMLKELLEARARQAEMETHVAGSNSSLKEIEHKLSEAQQNIEKLRFECEELKHARDNAVREAQILRQRIGEISCRDREQVKFSVVSFSELQEATKNFDDSLKIGEGGYGRVYKGFLRHTKVAIKLLNLEGMQGKEEFRQEVEVLINMRHPHLVTLIGTCPEAFALIYEYLPQGSLEDRLECKDKTNPLPWAVRIRIAAEICSALIFLHSNKPHGIVHGDLKPANILLDDNFLSKLSDFGISRHVAQFNITNTSCCHTNPKGTLGYMDPEFFSSGDITLAADIYSFGVMLLRLLTGKPALGIINQVQEAVKNEKLNLMLDRSAGKCPYFQAKQLAELALKCCDARRKNRPSLDGEVWKVLEPMVKVNECGKLHPLSCSCALKINSIVPSYFICPISQEVMRDPHVAEDGFTYEGAAIRKWFESGKETSPMTNRQFQHQEIIPNRGLRSFIQEWRQMNGFTE